MICANPDEACPWSLKSDRGQPLESRPTFLVRAKTCRESRAAYRRLEEAQADGVSETDAEAVVEAVVREGLAGGRNVVFRGQPVDVLTASPLDYLTRNEAWELAYGVAGGMSPPEVAAPLLGLPPATAPA